MMKAIFSALAQLHLTGISKDSTNPHFKNRYASLPHLLDTVMPELKKLGLGMIQPITHIDGVPAVETILFHESGESISRVYPLVGVQRQDPQGFGSAITYARRYSALAMLNLAQEDDDGEGAGRVTVTDEDIQRMLDAFKSLNVSERQLSRYLGHPVKRCNPTEITGLGKIYQELTQEPDKRTVYFREEESPATVTLNDRFKHGKKTAASQPSKP